MLFRCPESSPGWGKIPARIKAVANSKSAAPLLFRWCLQGWIALAALVLWAPLRGEGESAIGMILVSTGEAHLIHNGETQDPDLARLLYAGDIIAVDAGEVSFLFCPSVETVTVGPRTSVKVASNLEVIRGDRVEKNPARRCTLPRVALGSASLERIGALRARGFPPIVVFLGGRIRVDRPIFRWQGLEKARTYQLLLRASSGREIWKTETTETGLEYPADRPPLDPGAYSWILTARGEEGVVGEQRTRFQVKPDPTLIFSPSSDSKELLLRATELENRGFYAEAAEMYTSLRRDSCDERLTRHLAWLYWESGLIAAANVEKTRLE